ncbi:MAG: succinate dehydrogenase/fumarate reductase iron-sulfur subunit [Jaaginema sp. PMC 1080.18]|nr:succinate dehydrogenase/fumarate reductase iron-sulfur subunit [Jaaginema sp. PMC 1080.18]MEC4868123.1 succinate dehydrogenase/fumarate reductase iron-sulfur subunit [Jaaginema sp. PMC 1078.18]
MKVNFKVSRQQPEAAPRTETYLLDVEPGNTILECLNRIKWELDGSLAFRKNCRNTICGSCGMKINNRSALACKENVGQELQRLGLNTGTDIPEIAIAPMGNLPVIKDLVVDMTPFWDNLEAVDPYVSTQGRQIPEREFLQTPEVRSQLEKSGNCILCGACYSECNAKAVNPQFVGPHALAKAQRLVNDNRDSQTIARLEKYHEGIQGAWGCTRCYLCNAVCPMDVAPMDRISEIKQDILDRKTAQDSRSVRHRKVLIDLVKDGGWIDERKFGLMVVGDYFRDLRGLLELAPLGLRMLVRGKFPMSFEPSQGTLEVRSLIESVQNLETESS